jgi:hypothetical protein
MRRKIPAWAIAAFVFQFALPARAMLGMETVPLMRIALESVKQTLHLEQLSERIRQNLELMRETANMARASTEVSHNVQALLKDPELRFADIVRTWGMQFPELRPIISSAHGIRTLHREEARTDALYAFNADNRTSDALDDLNRSSFEVLAHATEPYGVNDPHDRAIEGLRRQYEIAVGNLESLALSARTHGGIRPLEAGVWTAQATSVAAVAAVRTSATVEQIARTQELQYARAEEERRKAQAENAKQRAIMSQSHIKSWALRPTVGP